MPNIKVVSQHKKAPSLDLVIDFEETYNPLSQSKGSVRGNKPPQPAIVDEEDPDVGSDDDDQTGDKV